MVILKCVLNINIVHKIDWSFLYDGYSVVPRVNPVVLLHWCLCYCTGVGATALVSAAALLSYAPKCWYFYFCVLLVWCGVVWMPNGVEG